MSTNTYIAIAWIVTLTAIALYSLWVIRRGREVSAEVPEEERRWM